MRQITRIRQSNVYTRVVEDVTIDGTTAVTIKTGACPLVSLEVPAGKKAKFSGRKGRYKPV